jgi:GntR family transcriptional regulator
VTAEQPVLPAAYPEPLWTQAATLLRTRIADGELRPGARLPPERDLCQQLAISRVTLRKALAALVDEGVLRSAHGRGWYVTAPERGDWPNTLESFSETARRMGFAPTSMVLRAAAAPASFDEAEAFQIAPGTPLFRLDRVRLLDGVPIAVDESVLPVDVAEDFDGLDFTTASLYVVVTGRGFQLAQADTTIEARPATAAVAGHLGVPEATPILQMHQVVRDRAGRPLLSSTIRYAGDRYRLRTSFTRNVGTEQT